MTDIPVFHGVWKTAFFNAEKELGFQPMTKAQLNASGYQIGKKLPKPCAAVEYSKGKDGLLLLYNIADATKKRPVTDKHKSNLEAARKKQLCCDRCERRLNPHEKNQENCDRCNAIVWAKNLLQKGFIILDTETTGLHNADIVELSVINHQGHTLINQRLKPYKAIEEGAQAIHGISADDVKDCQNFTDIYPKLRELIEGKILIVYNYSYDWPIIRRLCKKYDLESINPSLGDCAMERYASFYGDWSDYHGSYRWQPLEGGDHSALGDCIATLNLIKNMAQGRYMTE